jgi:hypothetical protein
MQIGGKVNRPEHGLQVFGKDRHSPTLVRIQVARASYPANRREIDLPTHGCAGSADNPRTEPDQPGLVLSLSFLVCRQSLADPGDDGSANRGTATC